MARALGEGAYGDTPVWPNGHKSDRNGREVRLGSDFLMGCYDALEFNAIGLTAARRSAAIV